MIPEGWSIEPLGELVRVQGGNAFKSELFGEAGVPVVRISSIQAGAVSLQDAPLHPYDASLARFELKDGDLLIAMSGATTGKLGRYRKKSADERAYLNQRVGRFQPNSGDDRDLDYCWYILQTERVQTAILGDSIGGAQPNVSGGDIERILVKVPTSSERWEIVKVLGAWDRAIETVEALIANARAQKQALMQQLLPQGTTPPKKRLPGFSGEWKRVALADIGTISSAGVDKNIVEGEAEVRLLNFLDAYNREFIYDSDLNHRVTAPTAKVQGCNVRKGDVFFTPSSETRDDIALAAVAAEDMPGVVYSYHVVRFRPTKKLDLKFCAFVFQTDDFKRQAYRLGDGSGQRYVISQSNFRKMLVSLPNIDEQASIGALLADHSTIIADYEAQLTALRQEKAALMQQLLTGKRRVKLPESEVA